MNTEYRNDWTEHSADGHQIIFESRADDLIEENNDIEDDEEYLVGEEIIPSSGIIAISSSLDQIAAENLIYMAQDGTVEVMGDLIEEQVDQVDNADYNEQQYFECDVTEEVITDDWVDQQGEDRVEVPVDQLVASEQTEEILVPLPTDEYTTSRPYPCDFCSRRFRKKANLTNHMIAHKNIKPNVCNLCGARYIRKLELMRHLKLHAQVPDPNPEYNGIDGRADVSHIDDGGLAQTTNRLILRAAAAGNVGKRPYKIEALDEVDYVFEPAQNIASKPFTCNVCGLGFTREKAFNSHVMMHGVQNALECDTCNEVFFTVESLEEHQKLHLDEEDSGSEYEPDDDKTASDDDEDDEAKYGDYFCTVCGMAFHRMDLLHRHMKAHKISMNKNDTADDGHCCNVCGSIFAEALDLLAHAEIHTRSSDQKCTLCGELFINDNAIRQHIATTHSKELTSTTCHTCGRHCKDERTLAKHQWDHSKEKNHFCVKCGKRFFNKARLKRHMQSHRNKSVNCAVCGETFPDGRSLMNHRHSHNNLSGRQFPCRECGKVFGSRSSQQIHMRIHTGERPYGCRFCWKAFADGGTLRKHERIHTGEKPYACPVCPRAFNQRVVLREHIRSHHSAPDPSYEHSSMPYYCGVCGNVFKSSDEIIQHLIEHSDANTVSNRRPVVGPRKYKRRRKLKPEELKTIRNATKDGSPSGKAKKSGQKRGANDVSDIYSSSCDTQDESTTKGQSSKDLTDEEFNKIFKTIVRGKKNAKRSPSPNSIYSSADDDYVTPVAPTKKPSPAKRPQTSTVVVHARTIHTSKKKVVVEPKGNRSAPKTKTIITSRITNAPAKIVEPANSNATRKSSRAKATTTKAAQMDVLETQAKPLTNGTSRRRNQSLSEQTNTTKTKTNASATSTRRSAIVQSDAVSDFDEIPDHRSPIKTMTVRTYERNHVETSANDARPSTRSSNRLRSRGKPQAEPQHQQLLDQIIEQPPRPSNRLRSKVIVAAESSIDEAESSAEDSEMDTSQESRSEASRSIVIKQEQEVSYTMGDLYTCEMCSAVFSDRAQLLMHVPIHI